MTLTDLIDAIGRGDFDNDLQPIWDALRARELQNQKMNRILAAASIGIGSRVRVKGTVRPKFLVGITGRVERIPTSGSTFAIKPDVAVPFQARRYVAGDGTITLYGETLELMP